jgi:hypothetical protein
MEQAAGAAFLQHGDTAAEPEYAEQLKDDDYPEVLR